MTAPAGSPFSGPHRSFTFQPFSETNSSPTTSNTSTGSMMTSYSTNTSPTHSKTFGNNSTGLNASTSSNESPEKKIRTLGESWISSSFLPPPSYSTSPTTRRARSPSAPALPTTAHPVSRRPIDIDLSRRLAGLEIDPIGSCTRNEQAGRYPGSDLAHQPVSARQDPGFIPRRLPVVGDTAGPTLFHHASVPNLSERRVRFDARRDELEERDTMGLVSASVSSSTSVARGKNVYIASVNPDATEEALNAQASRFGEVLMSRVQACGEPSANLQANGTSWRPATQRHCAFVLFKKHEEAAAFIDYLTANNIPCDYGKEDFQTEWKSREDPESSNLYIQGLPLSATAMDIHKLLEPFGRVASLKLLESGASRIRRGPVLARLECRPQAEAAIKALNGKKYGGENGPVLQVRIADSEKQKEFKRQASMNYNQEHHDAPTLPRRASMAVIAQPDLHDTVTRLEAERQKLMQALEDNERRKRQLAIVSAPYTRRGSEWPHSNSPTTPSDDYAVHGHDVDAYGNRVPSHWLDRRSSAASLAPARTDRTWSMSPSAPNWHIDLTGGIDDYPATDRFSNIHHVRSSPNLGLEFGKCQAKDAWHHDEF